MAVDHVDLIQLHNLVEPDDWNQAFAPGGAVDALAAARDEGLVSHLGVTGHGLRILDAHLRSLERFDFASVLLPVNFILLELPDYRASLDRLLEVCAERGVAVQTIKSIARGRWSPDVTRRFSWYEPLTDHDAIGRAVRFVLSHPAMFLNTTSDARLIDPIVAAAQVTDPSSRIEAPPAEALRADIDTYGITPLFDGTTLERVAPG
jgi:predicted aldo/keto reductase-like oxidoreductase